MNKDERAQNHRALVEDALIAHFRNHPHSRIWNADELSALVTSDTDEIDAFQRVDALADLHDIEMVAFTEDGRTNQIIVKFRGTKNGEPADYIYQAPTSLNVIIMNYVLGLN